MKKILLLSVFALTGCQLQVNIASPVNNVTVIKAQHESDNADMSGSKLDDVARDISQKGGDVKGTP